jgi:CarD family transcriptional regulator
MATKKSAAKPTARKTATKSTTKKTASSRTTKKTASDSTAKKTASSRTASKASTKTTAGKAAPKKAPPKEPATTTRKRRKAPAFGVGDKVVHPHHGAAVITKKVKQTVAGERRDYFVLEIATDQLTVFVPVDNIEESIRPVISKAQARKVLQLFKEPPQEAGSNWSRWYKVLNEKMTSGDIYQVAEVVRDLTFAQQTKGISPALKRMLSKARLTLTSELQFALAIEEEEATKKLDRALPKVEPIEV